MLLKQCGNAKRSKHLEEDIHRCQSLVVGARPEPGACLCSAGGASSQPLIEDRSNAAAFGSELNRSPLTQGMWPAICQHAESIPSLICYNLSFPSSCTASSTRPEGGNRRAGRQRCARTGTARCSGDRLGVTRYAGTVLHLLSQLFILPAGIFLKQILPCVLRLGFIEWNHNSFLRV